MSEIPKAVALSYDEQRAPIVSAKGDAALAQEIIDIAEAHGIPLYENKELVEMLSRIELGAEIPEILYRVIAEIIAFAYHLQGKVPEGFPTSPNETDTHSQSGKE